MNESPQMRILGPVDAVGAAESRITHQSPDHEGVWYSRQNTGSGLLCTTASIMLIVDSIVKVVSHVGIWTFSAE